MPSNPPFSPATPGAPTIRLLLGAVAVAALVVAGPARAAVTYELKIGSIAGGSTAQGYTGWIDVSSFSWGVSNAVSTGGGTGGGTGRAVFQDFAWSQGIDSSIVPIFLGVANGLHYPTAELDVRTSGENPQPFFEMIFGDAMLTGLNVAGTGDAATARGSLDYSRVTMRYRPQLASGGFGTWIEGSFSLSGNAVVFAGDANVLTGLFESGGTVDLSGVAIAPVPEPQSWALMLAGLGTLGWLARRRSAA